MTTVELLAGFMIAVLLLGAGFTVFFTSSGVFSRYGRRREGELMVDGVCGVIENQAAFAGYIAIGREPFEGIRCLMISEEGRVFLDGEALYPEDFYDGSRIVVEIPPKREQPGPEVLKLTVLAEDENGEALSSSDLVVKLVNIKLYGGSVGFGPGEDWEGVVDSREEAVYISYQEVEP